MNIREAIKVLIKIEKEHGSMDLNVYLSQSKQTVSISEIVYDEEKKDTYVATSG